MAGKRAIEAPLGLLSGLGEIFEIMQAEGICYEHAHARWLESRREPEDSNVVFVDFRRGNA